jgi:hypothetical protein
VTTTIVVCSDGCEQDAGFEWGDDNPAECTNCNWEGKSGELYDDEEEEDD